MKNRQLSLELALLRAQFDETQRQHEKAGADSQVRDERMISSLRQAHVQMMSTAMALRGLLAAQSSQLAPQTAGKLSRS